MNVFQNNAVAGGQTVPHYHVHVVPRYPDDGGTFGDGRRVSLEERQALADRLIARIGPAHLR